MKQPDKKKEDHDGDKELRIKIEEVPNKDILIYHITDKLTDKIDWSFESEDDLEFGGTHSLNFKKEEVPEELQYLAGMFLVVEGVIKVDFRKYEITFEKSPVFEWPKMEKEFLSITEKLLAKNRKVIISERVRMRIDVEGRAKYVKLKI